jgi:hypothetical protein
MADRWMTYENAGALFGLSAEAMRKRARRQGWEVRQPNEPGAKAQVRVPDGAELRPHAHPPGRPAGDRADGLEAELRRRAEVAEGRAEAAEDARDKLAAELIKERERRARAEGENGGLRIAFEQAQGRAERAEAGEAARRADFQQALGRAERVEAERDAAAEAARLAQERVQKVKVEAAAECAARQESERERDAAQAELAEWTAGGPLARAWRALIYRREQS